MLAMLKFSQIMHLSIMRYMRIFSFVFSVESNPLIDFVLTVNTLVTNRQLNMIISYKVTLQL